MCIFSSNVTNMKYEKYHKLNFHHMQSISQIDKDT